MGCCIGAEHNDWCAEYDIVYVDAAGKEYCIFHAPADCKFVSKYVEGAGEKPGFISGEDFNTLVFARIQCVIDAGEGGYKSLLTRAQIRIELGKSIKTNKVVLFDWYPKCDFAGTIFFANISFSEFNGDKGKYLPSIKFNFSQFHGVVYFSSSQFRGYAHFCHCQFQSSVYFSSSEFWGIADFISTEFWGGADFNLSQFQNYAYFRSSQFRDSVNFSEGCFKKVFFENAVSLKKINFKCSTFEDSIFDNMCFKGAVFFDEAWFLGQSSFKNTIFYDYSNFEKAEFYGEVNFKHALFKEWTYFRNVTFDDKTSFAGTISKETILIEATDLTNLSLVETNIESFKFIECEWDKDKYGINCVYDEVEQKELGTKNSTLEEIYRRLKKVSRESSDEVQTSDWHYKEKEMKRIGINDTTPLPNIHSSVIVASLLAVGHILANYGCASSLALVGFIAILGFYIIFLWNDILASKNWFSKIYLNVYYWISGYGEKPERALIAFVVLLFPIVFLVGVLFGPPEVGFQDRWLWYLPLVKYELAEGTVIPKLSYFMKGVCYLLLSLQAALFAFALRNKLRR
ncbi:pentapeptide repeat-containing protein [Maridesulfovibrio frigidus]|uniref:pentapeptide repeat-containing protein n=1 Tax=Maridesulfovibrio frigidus TaxID=340956 RepID=UPI0004E1DD0E|nr:pentapeptide repeat-containing protein [Maridesulfovibrio frigidus]